MWRLNRFFVLSLVILGLVLPGAGWQKIKNQDGVKIIENSNKPKLATPVKFELELTVGQNEDRSIPSRLFSSSFEQNFPWLHSQKRK